MKVLIASGDAGAGAAIAPVAAALAARPGAEVRVAAAPFSAPHFERASLTVEPFERAVPLLAWRPDVCLGGASWGAVSEMPAIAAAGAAGIPTVVMLDFWSHYRERFTAANGRLVQPGAIAVIDEDARAGLIAAGLDASRVHVTGGPQFDRLASLGAAFDDRARTRLRNEIAGGDPFVLFVSQPIEALVGRQWGFTESEVLLQVRDALAQPGRPAVLGVKWHPREEPRPLPAGAGRVRLVDLRAYDSVELVLAADIVAGINSMLLLEAALLGRLSLSVQPGLCGADPLVSNARGLTRAVYDPGLLPHAIAEALDPAWRQAWRARLPDAPPPPATAAVIRLVESQVPGAVRSHDVEARNKRR